jgi:NitT/TauT family transport system permease protein
MTKAIGTEIAQRAISFALLLATWQIAAEISQARVFPGLAQIGAALLAEIATGNLIHHLAITMFRVIVSFVLAMALGTVLGVAMGRSKRLDALLDGWVTLLLLMPALVIIVLAYVWFGLIEAAAIGAVVLNKFPSVVITMREGARGLDRDFVEMAECFRVDRWRRLRHITLPQLTPFLFSAARNGLSIVWKIVLVVELLGRSDGIGFQIGLFYQLWDVPRLMAYAITFVVVVQAIEWGALIPMERRAFRWRR